MLQISKPIAMALNILAPLPMEDIMGLVGHTESQDVSPNSFVSRIPNIPTSSLHILHVL